MYGSPPGLPVLDRGESFWVRLICWTGAVGFAVIALGRALDPGKE